MMEHEPPRRPAGVEVGLGGGLEALAARVEALHGASSFQTWRRRCGTEVGGGGAVDVLAGDGLAARFGVLAEDVELRLRIMEEIDIDAIQA